MEVFLTARARQLAEADIRGPLVTNPAGMSEDEKRIIADLDKGSGRHLALTPRLLRVLTDLAEKESPSKLVWQRHLTQAQATLATGEVLALAVPVPVTPEVAASVRVAEDLAYEQQMLDEAFETPETPDLPAVEGPTAMLTISAEQIEPGEALEVAGLEADVAANQREYLAGLAKGDAETPADGPNDETPREIAEALARAAWRQDTSVSQTPAILSFVPASASTFGYAMVGFADKTIYAVKMDTREARLFQPAGDDVSQADLVVEG